MADARDPEHTEPLFPADKIKPGVVMPPIKQKAYLETGFIRYTQITGPSIIAPQGAIHPNLVPKGFTEINITTLPAAMDRSVGDFMNPGEWKSMKETPFNLPMDAMDGELRPTKQGQLYMFIADNPNEMSIGNWYFLSSVAGTK